MNQTLLKYNCSRDCVLIREKAFFFHINNNAVKSFKAISTKYRLLGDLHIRNEMFLCLNCTELSTISNSCSVPHAHPAARARNQAHAGVNTF